MVNLPRTAVNATTAGIKRRSILEANLPTTADVPEKPRDIFSISPIINWKLFLKNREEVKELDNLTFKLSPTVSVMNMKHLPKLYKTGLELNLIQPKDFYINILERPFYFNIKALPQEKKQEVESIFQEFFNWDKSNSIPNEIVKSFQESLDFMNHEDLSAKYWPQYIKETKILDELRGEDQLIQ